MEQRDWELLDKQMRGLSPPRDNPIIVLTVVAVFFAGMTLGSFLFPRQGEPVQITSWDVTACDYPSEWCATSQTAIAGVRRVGPGDSRHIVVDFGVNTYLDTGSPENCCEAPASWVIGDPRGRCCRATRPTPKTFSANATALNLASMSMLADGS